MTLPLARTSSEARLYLDLHPCECGELFEPTDHAIVDLGDDELGSLYSGTCPGCGRRREFRFRLPEDVIVAPPGEVRYGDGSPSELLDPGEWLWVADRYAGASPADVSTLDAEARRTARQQLAAAAAAMDEVLAFVPSDAEDVPAEAFRSELGRGVYAQEPGRFWRDRLEVVRDTYREMLAEMDSATR